MLGDRKDSLGLILEGLHSSRVNEAKEQTFGFYFIDKKSNRPYVSFERLSLKTIKGCINYIVKLCSHSIYAKNLAQSTEVALFAGNQGPSDGVAPVWSMDAVEFGKKHGIKA